MKIEVIKQHGGRLNAADDIAAEKLKRFKNGEQYTIEIKATRNPAFHRKMFAFMKFCFEHWRSDREFTDESQQFELFRKQLVITAGFYHQCYTLKGDVRLVAKSLNYASMDPDEFESCYHAVIQAAMKHIFKTTDDNTYNKLLSFF